MSVHPLAKPAAEPGFLLERADVLRLDAARRVGRQRQSELGQFLTPAPIAKFMASMFAPRDGTVRLLDAGAGVGSLTAAAVEELCGRRHPPRRLDIVAYEIDALPAEYLAEILRGCTEACQEAGIQASADLRPVDFIQDAVRQLGGDLFGEPRDERYTWAILNPPYRKIHSASAERDSIRRLGIETSNLYTAFLALVIRLLEPGGELVAITPRSFCNGPYFRPFRRLLLDSMALRRVHVFESRDRAFSDDAVLQENVIFHAVKGAARESVVVSTSSGPGCETSSERCVPHEELVRPTDPEMFIRLAVDGMAADIADRMGTLPATLASIGLAVSTGRVVDFRARQSLRRQPTDGTVPLIYPCHISEGLIRWPLEKSRKPNAILDAAETLDLLIPAGTYVVVKRFSSKEERRRVVAAVLTPAHVSAERIGLENHLNYFHRDGRGLPHDLAMGLAGFLNSTLLDAFFRQFSGHTQVNATDLRSLRYPTTEQLSALGARLGDAFPAQDELDQMVEEELFPMAAKGKKVDPVRAKRRMETQVWVADAPSHLIHFNGERFLGPYDEGQAP